MLMVTRLVRVLKYCKELPPINLHNPSRDAHVRLHGKLNKSPPEKTHELQTRQVADI